MRKRNAGREDERDGKRGKGGMEMGRKLTAERIKRKSRGARRKERDGDGDGDEGN